MIVRLVRRKLERTSNSLSNDRISLDLLGLDGIYAFPCKPLKRAKYTKQDFSDIGEQVA